MTKRYYLAYGSNMNVNAMAKRCPTAEIIGAGTLKGYQLKFKQKSGYESYATIVPSDKGSVPFVLWSIEREDELELDKYEVYPDLYRKELLTVSLNGMKYEAMVYLMNEPFDNQKPTEDYLMSIVEGYQAFNFDTSTLKNPSDEH